jgi:hypothetical protein
MQAVSASIMERSLRIIVACLLIFTLLAATEVTEAGTFENFFNTLRRSFAHPPPPKPAAPPSHRSSRKQNNEARPGDALGASNNQASPTPTPSPAPPNRDNVRVAKAIATKKNGKNDLPYGIPVPGKQGLVTSPFSPDSGYIDVRSFPPGTEVSDPYTGKSFLTP